MRRPLLAVCVLLVAVVWAIYASGGRLASPDGKHPKTQWEDGTVVYATGQIAQKEKEKIRLRSVTICLSDDSEKEIPYEQNLICELKEGQAEAAIGAAVTVRGTFMHFSPARNPGEFDAAVYYRSLGVGGKIRKAELVASDGGCGYVRETAYRLKQYLGRRLDEVFNSDAAGVMRALLLGDKTELDGEVKQLYQRNGILHILSISSLHITMIGMCVYALLRKLRLPIIPAAIGGSLILLFYGWITGFAVSACRAIGMYFVRMGAELVGRSYDMLTAMGVMALIMVLKEPYYLQNAGFLLSFGSVAGIGLLLPALSGQGEKKTGARYVGEAGWRVWLRRLWQSVRESCLVSLSVTLATLPIQLWNFYEVPLYALFLNLLIIPLVKPLLLSGFLCLFPFLGSAGRVSAGILWCYETACGLFDRLPFHTWVSGRPQIWQLVLYYGILTGVVLWEERKRAGEKRQEALARRYGGKESCGLISRKRGAGLKFGMLAAAVFVLAVNYRSSDRVVFLDVGQGDCCLIQTAEGGNYLFDGGSSNRSQIGRYVILPCLKYYGISEIDAVLVSHADADHINGITELLRLAEDNHLNIRQLVLPELGGRAPETQFSALLKEAEKSKVRYLGAGESWSDGMTEFICLAPKRGQTATDSNSDSMCVYGKFQDFSLLLTGDVEGEGERNLTEALKERGISEVTVLKVAHHGSAYSTEKNFLAQVKPELAVISCGKTNSYGHPHEETLKRLEDIGAVILTTPEYGAVTLEGRGEIKVYGYR